VVPDTINFSEKGVLRVVNRESAGSHYSQDDGLMADEKDIEALPPSLIVGGRPLPSRQMVHEERHSVVDRVVDMYYQPPGQGKQWL